MVINWVNEQQAAERSGRSSRTLRLWRQRGEVIAYKQGKSLVLYSIQSLDQCSRLQRERIGGRPPK